MTRKSKFNRFISEVEMMNLADQLTDADQTMEEKLNAADGAVFSDTFLSAFNYYKNVIRNLADQTGRSLNETRPRKRDEFQKKMAQTMEAVSLYLQQADVYAAKKESENLEAKQIAAGNAVRNQNENEQLKKHASAPDDADVIGSLVELRTEMNRALQTQKEKLDRETRQDRKRQINADIRTLEDNLNLVGYFTRYFRMLDFREYTKALEERRQNETDQKVAEIVKETDPDDRPRIYDKGLLAVFAKESQNSLTGADGRISDPALYKLLGDVIKYAEKTPVVTSERNSEEEENPLVEEAKDAGKISTALDQLMNKFEEETDYSEKDDQRLLIMANLQNYFDAELNGKLGLSATEMEDENSLHIHYSGKYLSNHKYEKNLWQFKKKHEKKLLAKGKKTADEHEMETDRRDDVLFPHEPSPYDVSQGCIGNCYFVATLSEIAAKHPEKIKEMIRDNRDGTATVRFYHYKNSRMEPFYVTVDKYFTDGQAEGALWVQVIERAWAVSGMMKSVHTANEDLDATNDLIKEAQPVPLNIDELFAEASKEDSEITYDDCPWVFENFRLKKWNPDLDQTSGGREEYVMSFLLGDAAKTTHVKIAEELSRMNGNIPVSLSDGYTEEETEIADRIKNAVDEGRIVTAGSVSAENDHIKIAGINLNHAYSVLDVIKKKISVRGQEVTRTFVKLRNPHGNTGRTYYIDPKTCVLVAKENTEMEGSKNYNHDGITYVELKHFVKEFDSVEISKVADTDVTRSISAAREEKNALKEYREIMKQFKKKMSKASGKITINSGEWNELRDAVDDFVSKKPANYAELGDKLKKIASLSRKYESHCVSSEKEREKETTAQRIEKHALIADLNILTDAALKGIFAEPSAYVKHKIAEKYVDQWLEKHPEKVQQFAGPEGRRDAVNKMIHSEFFAKNTFEYETFDECLNLLRSNEAVTVPDAVFAEKIADRDKVLLGTLLTDEEKAEAPKKKKTAGNGHKLSLQEELDQQRPDIDVKAENEIVFAEKPAVPVM